MRELSLFSGAGGGLLGTHLLGWEPIGYVEWNEYCQRVIAARISDGFLPTAPIFTDVREFVQSGAAREYRGFADVVTGGFPCQPFSAGGKRAGADDERNMWPATIDVIREVRPRYAFMENVSGLLASGYFGTILGDLAQSGYDCRWRILSAAEMGAPHRRDRLWIVAYSKGDNAGQCRLRLRNNGEGENFQEKEWTDCWDKLSGCGDDMAHATSGESLEHTDGEGNKDIGGGSMDKSGGRKEKMSSKAWRSEPDVGRMVDGMAWRLDRLKALGNGQVPLVAATAWQLLTEGLQ